MALPFFKYSKGSRMGGCRPPDGENGPAQIHHPRRERSMVEPAHARTEDSIYNCRPVCSMRIGGHRLHSSTMALRGLVLPCHHEMRTMRTLLQRPSHCAKDMHRLHLLRLRAGKSITKLIQEAVEQESPCV